jgi:hypothetical protein
MFKRIVNKSSKALSKNLSKIELNESQELRME